MAQFLSGIASKAAGALSKAKEQIREMTSQDYEDDYDKKVKATLDALKDKCNNYKEQYELLQKNYAELMSDYQLRRGQLVDLKIVIGCPDSPLLLQELEGANRLLAKLRTDSAKMQEQQSVDRSRLTQQESDLRETRLQLKKAEDQTQRLDASQRALKAHINQLAELTGDPISASEEPNELLSKQVQAVRSFVGATATLLDRRGSALFKKDIKIDRQLDAIEESLVFILDQHESKTKQAEEIRRASEQMYHRSVLQVAELTGQLEEAKGRLRPLENVQEDFSSFKQEHQRVIQEYSVLIQQHSTASSKFGAQTERISLLAGEGEQMTKNIERLTKENQSLISENARLRADCTQIELNLSEQTAYASKLQPIAQEVVKYDQAFKKLESVLRRLQEQLEGKNRQIDQLQSELDESELRSQQLSAQKAQLDVVVSTLNQQLTQNGAQKQQARREYVRARSMREEAQGLALKITGDIADQEHLIDKRVIGGFIVHFLNPGHTDKVRFQMLANLANMLDFDEAQRRRVGIIQEGLFSQLASYISKG